jgi:hypothetical protein
MVYVRLRSYFPTGEFTGCEHLFLGNDHVKALDWFRKEYPEHKDCVIVAETYDSEDPKNKEHFSACKICGCVHPF